MAIAKNVTDAVRSSFGSLFVEKMAITHFRDGAWEPFQIQPYAPLPMDPAAHVFHYASTCFEGLKAHRHADDSVHIFRLNKHMKRFERSAKLLCMPVPDPDEVGKAVSKLVRENKEWVPEEPGSLYIRPTLIGTLPNIGAAAHPTTEACLFILLSPVGDYFEGGLKPLKLLIEPDKMRTSPSFGSAKTGGNYAASLGQIMSARETYGTSQVLFAPGGDVQETGAANFLLINDKEILTKKLNDSFLHGVTRDSILQMGKDMGYKVTERDLSIEEVIDWVKDGEAALSGTAAVLAGIGSFVYRGETISCGNGEIGPNTLKLRQALVDIHGGKTADAHGWLTRL